MYPPSNWSNINRRHQNLYQVEYISSNNYVKSRYGEPSNYSRESQSRPSYNPSQYLSKINVPPSRGRTTIRPDSSVRYKSKKSTKSIDQDSKQIQIPNKPSSKYRKDRAEYQINDKIPTFKNSTNASFNSIPTNNQSIPIYRPRVVNQQTGQHIENHNKGNRSNTVVKKIDIEIRKAINEQINGEELRRSHSENKADEVSTLINKLNLMICLGIS